MAASYIRIVLVGLIGIAALMLAIGYAIGVRFGRTYQPVPILIGCGAVVPVLLSVGAAKLGVTGSVILDAIVALFVEMTCALMCGYFMGRMLKKERRDPGRIVAVCLGISCLLAIGFQVKNIHPVFDTLQTAGLLKPKDDYKPETNKDCPANLQSVYNAFEQYAELNDKLPDAAKWQDDTDFTSRIPQDEWLHCPAVSNRHDDKFGYALNDAVAGKKLNLNGKPLKSLPNAATTPLLYDSANTNKNAHDAVTSMPRPGRHGGRNNILYLDGHVAAVAPK